MDHCKSFPEKESVTWFLGFSRIPANCSGINNILSNHFRYIISTAISSQEPSMARYSIHSCTFDSSCAGMTSHITGIHLSVRMMYFATAVWDLILYVT